MCRLTILCFVLFVFIHNTLLAQAQPASIRLTDRLQEDGELEQVPVGLTNEGKPFHAIIHQDSRNCFDKRYHLLLISTPGSSPETDPAISLLDWFYHSVEAKTFRDRYTLSTVPAYRSETNSTGVDSSTIGQFPPASQYYQSQTAQAEQYLWRWIGFQAPDFVVVLNNQQSKGLLVPAGKLPALQTLQKQSAGTPEKKSLALALTTSQAGNTGHIPAVEIQAPASRMIVEFQQTLSRFRPLHSSARTELRRRMQRTPLEVAQELERFYGRKLDSVVYIPAIAMLARARLSELTGNPASLEEIEKTVQPYVQRQKPTLPERPTSSHLPGHLIFSELALKTGNEQYTDLVLQAADLGFQPDGTLKDSMPYHSEMSDSVFMGCPILAAAGRLTNQPKYYRMALKHLRFMQKLCLRKDGLYRHSPLCEAAWGRGNGFPALGLTLCLEVMPTDAPGYREILQAYQKHLRALLPYQDSSGMWHQVIDHPESYREMSCTCMITYALAVGVRQGWLDSAEFTPAIEKAWPAILQRIGPQGEIVDICTGTGKQPTLEDYFLRTAVLGKDDRGGAMALLIATEMARPTSKVHSR